MRFRSPQSCLLLAFLLIVTIISFISSSFVFEGEASPSSAYYYRFTVDREGSTHVVINFSSTDSLGSSWVFVPRGSTWNYTVAPGGRITRSDVVETDQVTTPPQKQYFYQAFKFSYEDTGVFNMTLQYDFSNGALIDEPRGIFYSPQIGFQSDSSGMAEVLLHYSFKASNVTAHALVVGATTSYPAVKIEANRVLFDLPENVVRIQLEFSVELSTADITVLKSSDNKTFTFDSISRYVPYGQNVLRLYDRIYGNFTRLFNTTLDSVAPVTVQWFLPDFNSLLTVGGFVPFTGQQLGEINLNVFFIRAINGTVEVIAAHELVHRFIGLTGISPSNFLWFHEGMAQYISVMYVLNLGYEGAQQQKDDLESSATSLIQDLGGENFGLLDLQGWTPNYVPPNGDINSLYVASYYVTSRLPTVAHHEGIDYYSRFFQLIHDSEINNIDVLALYLSMAANASVALTLRRWGFTVADLYDSPIEEMVKDAGKAIAQVNPVFQPYHALAQYFYQQALSAAEQGNWAQARSLLQLSITLANNAALLTYLTIIAILALLVLLLSRRKEKPKPVVPVPPSDIVQPFG